MKALKVLHKSEHFIIVNKDFDVIINTDDSSRVSLQQQLVTSFPHLVNKCLRFGFYFPHRLDYSTSGVMCIALSKVSCAAASSAFQDRSSQKYYLALLRGHVSQNFLQLDCPIGEDPKTDSKMMTDQAVLTRSAKSRLLVLERGIYASYPATKVLLRPLTGRRHQLRVHCHLLGHTIVGDYTYSYKHDVTPPRMFLHSYRLIMPNDVEELDIATEDPFTEETTPDWLPVESLHKLNKEAFQLLSSNESTIS